MLRCKVKAGTTLIKVNYSNEGETLDVNITALLKTQQDEILNVVENNDRDIFYGVTYRGDRYKVFKSQVELLEG